MSTDQVDRGGGSSRGSAAGFALARLWSVLGPLIGLGLITGFFAFLTRDSGTFLQLATWRLIVVQTVVLGIAALGMTLVMISGGIDLAVGSTVALVTVVVTLAVRDLHFPVPLAIAAGIALGGLCGFINGSLITLLRVMPFIITLGGLKIYRGGAKWLADNGSVYVPAAAKSPWMSHVLAPDPEPSWLVVAPGVWTLVVFGAIVAFLLRYSILGRRMYAVGSNEATARLCGINVSKLKVIVYTIAGLLTGLAGGMQFLDLGGSGDPTTADGLELQVIASVVIGGGSLSGGEGTAAGTLIGCLLISVLNNGCVHAGIPNASQDVIIGAIIIVAVTLDRFRRAREGV